LAAHLLPIFRPEEEKIEAEISCIDEELRALDAELAIARLRGSSSIEDRKEDAHQPSTEDLEDNSPRIKAAEIEALDPLPQALTLKGDVAEEEEDVAEDRVELSAPKEADEDDSDFNFRRELRKAELLDRVKLAIAASIASTAQEGEPTDDELEDGGVYADEYPPADESLDSDLGCEILSEEEADDLISQYCKRKYTIGGGANATGKA